MPFLLYIVVLFFFLWPESMFGCTVCGFGKEESRIAFILTTALLTLVPLVFIGGAVALFIRRANQIDEKS